MIDFGTVHLVDSGVNNRGCGTSTVAQAMFYYCLKILRLAGTSKLSLERVERAVASSLRKRRKRLDLGSVYSADGNNNGNDDTGGNFDFLKYKHIPLFLLDTAYGRSSSTRQIYSKGRYGDLFSNRWSYLDSPRGDWSCWDIVKAAIGRVVVIDSGYVPGSTNSYYNLDISSLLDVCVRAKTVKVVRWFVSRGSRESLDIFVDSIDRYSDVMTHILVLTEGIDGGLFEQFPYLEAVKDSMVIEFPRLGLGFEDDFSRGETDDVPACFASSGQFENLIEFSRVFKLEDLAKVSGTSNDGNRFASFWS